MVATHSHSRRTSGGSVANTRTRRRSSIRRQSEKISTAIIPPATTPNPSTTTSTPRPSSSHHGKRSRSVSTEARRQPQQQQQQQHLRRPSAPAAIVSTVPRLSIADRFMNAEFPPTPSVPPLPKQTSPSISTTTSLTSTLSAIPTAVSNNSKLSVADRFMNAASSPTQSTLNLSDIQQYRERSSSWVSGKNASTPSTPFLEKTMPERLTIASAFMKSSATTTPSRSRTASISELDMGVIHGNIKSTRNSKSSPATTTQIHPLEEPMSLFDDVNYPNLDLTIAPPSSDLNTRSPRPWGSQETLVHLYGQQEKKKQPIYAQYLSSEKDTGDNRSLSYSQYLDYTEHDKRTISDISTKQGYDDYDEIDVHYEKPYSCIDDEGFDDHESRYESSTPSPAISTTKLKKQAEEKKHVRGFWVGCCFVSCGQRPSQKTIEQKQKKRREKDLEANTQPKNRGFGRRGWVFCIFICLLILILVTFFLWPRTPLMRIEGASLTSPAKASETRQGLGVGNVAFESEWLVNITVDNRQNHIPTRLVAIQVLAKDALTGLVIGKGLHNDDPHPEHIVLAANTISTIQLPIRVDYQARDSTDTTFVDLTKACAPQQVSLNSPNNGNKNQRESLPLHFWITLHYFGLDWLNYKPTVIATPATGGFACPQS